jgi:hypothetical protein
MASGLFTGSARRPVNSVDSALAGGSVHLEDAPPIGVGREAPASLRWRLLGGVRRAALGRGGTGGPPSHRDRRTATLVIRDGEIQSQTRDRSPGATPTNRPTASRQGTWQPAEKPRSFAAAAPVPCVRSHAAESPIVLSRLFLVQLSCEMDVSRRGAEIAEVHTTSSLRPPRLCERPGPEKRAIEDGNKP